MGYNIFEILFVVGFMMFCFDNTIILLLGMTCMLIGWCYMRFHTEDDVEEQMEYFDEIDETDDPKYAA